MAKFKVGDRVKRVRDPREQAARATDFPIGAVGTVGTATGIEDGIWVYPDAGGMWGCQPDTLEPLTPPAEDTWAADKVKQLTKPVYVEPAKVGDEQPALRDVLAYYRSLGR